MHTLVKPAELKLNDGSTTITLRPVPATSGDPIMCREWDLGSPDVRITYNPIPGADGVIDGAGFLGSRNVSFDLQILGGKSPDDGLEHDAYWYLQKLAAMTHPARRPVLQIRRPGGMNQGQTFTMALRGNPYSISYTRQSAAFLELQLQFTAPTGVLEGPLQSLSTGPTGNSTGDWHWPMSFPYGFGVPAVGSNSPILNVPVGGTSAVYPQVYITGPCTNPLLRVGPAYTDVFSFTGLALSAGETVQIDMGAATVMKSSAGSARAATDLFTLVDWSQSTFWSWAPGIHQIEYVANSGAMTVQWRDRQIAI